MLILASLKVYISLEIQILEISVFLLQVIGRILISPKN